MTQETSYPTESSSSSIIVSIAVIVLSVLILAQSFFICRYISVQNQTMEEAVTGSKRQAEVRHQADQNMDMFVRNLLGYVQKTGDPEVVKILRNYGVNIQFQQPGTTAPRPGTPATNAPTAPAPSK